jgi:hypothetical protein
MKPGFEEVEPRAPRLADNITDQSVRDIYARMLGVLRNLHDDVEVNESNVDVRASCGATFICRLVPYRELIHAQIGGSPKWEIRIRSENDSNEAIERILGTFLKSLSGVHAPASAQSELNSG